MGTWYLSPSCIVEVLISSEMALDDFFVQIKYILYEVNILEIK